MIVSIALFGVFAILLLLNVPIAVSLGVSSVVALAIQGVGFNVAPMIFYSSIAKFTLLAIPFFIMAGIIMEKAGISKRLIHFANTIVGHFAGGLYIVVVITSMFFAAISGSGPATVAALGVILIPAMIEAGYDKDSSTALMAISGGIGVIIPPSITYVVYGVVASQSIGKMFIAGVGPGIIMGLALIVTCILISRKQHYIPQKRASLKEIWLAFKDAFWGLLTPVIILGGIYGGIFTPTEAAAVAVVYGLFVGIFVYKEIKWETFVDTIVDSSISTGVVMLVISSATIFSWIITTEGIANMISSGLMSFTSNPIVILVLINIVLLIAGCFIDAVSAIYIFAPIFLPIITKLGVNPILFGIIMCVNLSIGLSTPPVGVNLYVACGITNISIERVSRALVPFFISAIIALLLITYIPGISLWLPNLLGFK